MTDWLEQYSAALDVRDAREKAHKPYIDAYTKLADRTASLPTASPIPPSTASPKPTPAKPSTPTPTDDLTTLRTDLATTQRARMHLQSRLQTLQTTHSTLLTTHTTTLTTLSTLQKQLQTLERRLKDKEAEIKGKASLVENAQDEMVALQLQLNMAEQKREEVERENEMLVERWMRRVGEEAERVNRDSRWE
ncbi:hypothetical protein PRZ48_002820 [Zasmidium cellare]|uniref:Autophagy-related protein 16 domain-containing protein n=1 Tax=Zasmidium cellare TaxID=395010 RepID=A0ABR0ETB0_ZASCE|nr:hypothetical protein PRZ48_002820 [Zasmidium cellare]